eukprot:Amastigsp_a177868_6.p5 type:complete len:139 gc:universal Amastigsp_a177868_6:792-1208(+)
MAWAQRPSGLWQSALCAHAAAKPCGPSSRRLGRSCGAFDLAAALQSGESADGCCGARASDVSGRSNCCAARGPCRSLDHRSPVDATQRDRAARCALALRRSTAVRFRRSAPRSRQVAARHCVVRHSARLCTGPASVRQ